MHTVKTTTWDIAINIGVKCNLLPISRKANIRYISSPFDNMDSVDGFAEMGDLIAARFENYFARSLWSLRNDYPANSSDIRAKIAWNINYPGLYYPHFDRRWFNEVHEHQLAHWVTDPEGKLDFVWQGLSDTYKRRQERFVNILDAKHPVLFVRLEDKANLRRILQRDVVSDALHFESSIKKSYPNTKFAIAYFYYDKHGRHFDSTETIYFEKIPMECDENFLIEKLSQFKIAPQKESFHSKND